MNYKYYNMNVPVLPAQRLDRMCRNFHVTFHSTFAERKRLCDQDMIYLLENSTLYFEDLMAYSKAISSIEVFENISFADTGRDCPEALIASVSDFMLALVEVSFSVVYSRKKEGIKISVRSERPTLDAGKIISKALKGIGSGGGHATMAGGFVPFDGNDREEDLMIQNIRERFIDVISRTKRKSLR